MTLAIVWRSCCSIIIIIMTFVGNGAEKGIDMPTLKRPISDNNNKKRRSSSPLVLTAAMSNEFAIFAAVKNTISGKNSTMPIFSWRPTMAKTNASYLGPKMHDGQTSVESYISPVQYTHSRCSVTKLTSAQVIPF